MSDTFLMPTSPGPTEDMELIDDVQMPSFMADDSVGILNLSAMNDDLLFKREDPIQATPERILKTSDDEGVNSRGSEEDQELDDSVFLREGNEKSVNVPELIHTLSNVLNHKITLSNAQRNRGHESLDILVNLLCPKNKAPSLDQIPQTSAIKPEKARSLSMTSTSKKQPLRAILPVETMTKKAIKIIVTPDGKGENNTFSYKAYKSTTPSQKSLLRPVASSTPTCQMTKENKTFSAEKLRRPLSQLRTPPQFNSITNRCNNLQRNDLQGKSVNLVRRNSVTERSSFSTAGSLKTRRAASMDRNCKFSPNQSKTRKTSFA